MNMRAKLCDNCNSEIITIKRGKQLVAECSYCGEPTEGGYEDEDFVSDYDGEDI